VDVRFVQGLVFDINADVRTKKLYYKQFYGNVIVQKDTTKVFYANTPSVSQYVTYTPTGLTAVDMHVGDLVKLNWDSDANYGYNVYRTSPLPLVKLNTYVVNETEYLVGNLTVNQPYTFVITGVDGVGNESGYSASATATPTIPNYTGTASRKHTCISSVKINGVVRTDVILKTVELGYGTSPAVARFLIPVDPATSGLPTHNDTVEVIVNSRSIFNGIIKNIEKSVSNSGKACSYIAYSRAILLTYNSVPWASVLAYRNLYNLDLSDQTWLQAYETIANFQGNYRLYFNMQTNLIEFYRLGTGYWNRTVVLGKNVIEWNITEDTLTKVNAMTVMGARKKTTLNWRDLEWTATAIGDQFIYTTEISAFNIGDIQVEAKQSLGQPDINYVPDSAVVPSDFGLSVWEDGTIEPKQVVADYTDPESEWRSTGIQIEYTTQRVGNEDIPVKAKLTLTSKPKLYQAHIEYYHYGVRVGRTAAENFNIGTVGIAYETLEFDSPFRLSYSYEEQTPTTFGVGSTTPSRTVTDTQYKIWDDKLNNEDNSSTVINAMTQRAVGELAKVSLPIVSGRIQILGDETFNLRTLVNIEGQMLDVIRVTHNFDKGFTTDIELTNEKFRDNVLPYQEMRRKIDFERRTTGSQVSLDDLNRKLKQQVSTHTSLQTPVKDVPKSPFALYAD